MVFASTSELESLLRDFYVATGLKLAVNDIENYGFTGTHLEEDDFCVRMSYNPSFHRACLECDRCAIETCIREKRGILYRCHIGFWEYIAPVIIDDMPVCTIFTGSAVDGSREEYDNIVKNLEKFGVTEEEFQKEYPNFPHMSLDKLRSTANLLEACISHIYSRNMLKVQYFALSQQVEKFLSDNLSSRLSVPVLCERFRLSEKEVTHLFQESFGCSVPEYICRKRMKLACRLMQQENSSITEIAAKVGYADYNYFSKVFRKRFGITPREYRAGLNTYTTYAKPSSQEELP